MNEPSPSAAPIMVASRQEENADLATRLTVVLVNYNGKQYLQACLNSVLRFAPKGTEVVLADNASNDGSPDEVARQFPWVRLVRSEINLGFAGGNNLASRQAHGRFLLLLNTDTELLEPIEPVLAWLEQHEAYGALTINMIDGLRVPQACTGKFPNPIRLALLRRMLTSPTSYGAEESYDVDWVQGSFVLIRTELWRKLGGLDEDFFMYMEDVDLCKRVWDTDAKCAYLPSMRYLHWGGYDSSRFPDQVRGLSIYVGKHMRGVQRAACRTVLLVGCILRVALNRIRWMIWRRQVDRMKADDCRRAFQVLTERVESTLG
jgi:GT2 family glycosyltransferase